MPLAIHYLEVSRGFSYTDKYLMNYKGFIASYSLFDNFIFKNLYNLVDVEQRNGLGLLIWPMVFLGFLKLEKRRLELFLFIVFVLLFYSVWNFNYFLWLVVPGASAIRAGGRAIFILLPVFCYLIGVFFENLSNKKPVFIFCIIVFLTVQIPIPPLFKWTKEGHVKRIQSYKIPDECKVFSIDDNGLEANNIDGMWVTNYVNKPTLSGYSGFIPKRRNLKNSNCTIKGFE